MTSREIYLLVAIIGPKSPYSLQASHILTESGGFQRLPKHASSQEGCEFTPSHSAGLFTASSVGTTVLPTDSSDIIIWDRVPAQDLKEMELPSKVILISPICLFDHVVL